VSTLYAVLLSGVRTRIAAALDDTGDGRIDVNAVRNTLIVAKRCARSQETVLLAEKGLSFIDRKAEPSDDGLLQLFEILEDLLKAF